MIAINSLIRRVYFSHFFEMIFHTLIYILKKNLIDCQSVLDLGCGPFSPLQYCENVKYSVGVEAFPQYLNESKRKKIHSRYIKKRIQDINFLPKSFDAVILIDVLEHLSKDDGLRLLKKAEFWARKKIIITTPNGYFPMDKVDKNIFQKHLSGWTLNTLHNLGFKCYGLAGIKFFYSKENRVDSIMEHKEINYFANMRFKPQKLFYFINSLFQIINYYFPLKSFELLAIKEI